MKIYGEMGDLPIVFSPLVLSNSGLMVGVHHPAGAFSMSCVLLMCPKLHEALENRSQVAH